MLEIKNLTKTFNNRTVLDNISFKVDKGTSLAITGQSGAGKSTLLNVIGTLESSDSGEIIVNGKHLPQVNSKAAMLLRRHTISYLFQSFALINDKTVTENLLLGLQYAPGTKSQKLAQITQILDVLSVSHLAKQQVKTLSGGEQQRVALARAIIKPGELILADEPTGSLDKKLALSAADELLHLQKAHGKTLIIVTHDPEIASLCDNSLQLPTLTPLQAYS